MISLPRGPLDPAGRTARIAALVSAFRGSGGVQSLWTSCAATAGVSEAALTLFVPDGRRLVVAAVGGHTDRLEDLQITLGQGPCRDAFTHARPALAADLATGADSRRWPRYAPRAYADGIRAVFAFPVLIVASPVAVLTLYRDTAGALSDAAHQHAADHAATAATLLLDAAGAGDGGVAALAPAAVAVLRATGMIMIQVGVDAVTALHLLRAHAHDHTRAVGVVADDVLAGRLRFEPEDPS